MSLSYLVELEKKVEEKINAAKSASEFVFNDFTVERTPYPMENVENLPAAGKVYIVGMGSDEERGESRQNTCKAEAPIQIGYQRAVVPTDTDTIDALKLLIEQLRDIVRKEVDPEVDWASWNRTENLKDDNGTPYSYMGLREGNFFEAYFTAFYTLVLS